MNLLSKNTWETKVNVFMVWSSFLTKYMLQVSVSKENLWRFQFNPAATMMCHFWHIEIATEDVISLAFLLFTIIYNYSKNLTELVFVPRFLSKWFVKNSASWCLTFQIYDGCNMVINLFPKIYVIQLEMSVN